MRFQRPALVLTAAALLLSACAPPHPVFECPRFNDEVCEQELEKGNLDRADTYCDLGLEFSPEYAELWALKGRISLLRKDTAQAKRYLLHALKLQPDHPKALLNLGYTYLEEGAYAASYERFSQALRLKPDYHVARFGQGRALWKLGRREEAQKELGAALEAAPDNVSFHHIFGMLNYTERNLEVAHQHLSRAAQLAPGSTILWQDLGKVLMEQGRFAEAEAAFLQCVQLEETHADCRAGLERARHEQPHPKTPQRLEMSRD
ncbi:tetratricopeptide repeat protein [Pyxidicoccus sp. 3LG]